MRRRGCKIGLKNVTYLPYEHTTKKTNVHKKYQIYAVYVGQAIPKLAGYKLEMHLAVIAVM